MSRYCDRCEVKPASAARGDFRYCTPCSEVIDFQELVASGEYARLMKAKGAA